MPVHHVKTDASYGGNIAYDNLSFINFKSNTTWCGSNSFLFALHPDSSDYFPRAKFTNTKFVNVD